MIKCCAFGTVRLDIHVYKEYDRLSTHEEVKVDAMALQIGGSVYNTISVLNELKQDVVFYTLNITDDISDFIKLQMINRNITFVSSKHESNPTAKTIIFVDECGKKKMISYDGVRSDSYVLRKLKKDICNYDLFYTSFYEINNDNLSAIIEIMQSTKTSFVDLSPLIYSVEQHVLSEVLEHVDILSGTSDEYRILLDSLNIQSIEQLIQTHSLQYVFVKEGAAGATLYYENGIKHCSPKEQHQSYDTTGCGDTFNAAVIYSISCKKTEDEVLRTAVDFASMIAYNGFNLNLFESKV